MKALSLRQPWGAMITEETKKIWEEVKANFARLDSCPGPHEFPPRVPGQPVFGVRHTCTKCGGHVDNQARNWYERGLAHGRAP